MVVMPSGKYLSTELWILLAYWHEALRKFIASTMRTCLLTTCALARALICSGALLVCVGLSASLRLTSTISVSPPPSPLVSKTSGPFVKGRPWSPASSTAPLCVQFDHVPNSCTSGFLLFPLSKAVLSVGSVIFISRAVALFVPVSGLG